MADDYPRPSLGAAYTRADVDAAVAAAWNEALRAQCSHCRRLVIPATLGPKNIWSHGAYESAPICYSSTLRYEMAKRGIKVKP